MPPSLLPLIIAFIVTALLIAVLQPFARRVGLTDKPAQRKQHVDEVPLVGGIAIYGGVSAALVTGYLLVPETFPGSLLLAWSVASLLMVAVGAYDDFRELSPAVRFAAQIVAALIMIYWGGVLLKDVGAIGPAGEWLNLRWLAVPFTVFAAVGIINAINMCDGLDGLSGNLTLVTLLCLGLADTIWGNSAQLPLINVMSAGIAGFLLFNQRMLWRSKAAVFLGDAGSMMLGLYLAWAAIAISQGDNRALSPSATLWFLIIPVYDTIRVMLRRLLNGQSPFAADARHLHHLLVKSGLSVSVTIAVICMAAMAGGFIGLLATALGVPEFWLSIVYTLGAVAYYVIVERAWQRRRFLGREVHV